MTRLEAAHELLRLTAALEDAVAVGDMGAAERLLVARARVLTETSPTPLSAADSAALEALAPEVRSSEERVRATLRRAIAGARAGLAAIATGRTATHAYLRGDEMAAGFVDRRD
jgi:hypothetical protein